MVYLNIDPITLKNIPIVENYRYLGIVIDNMGTVNGQLKIINQR